MVTKQQIREQITNVIQKGMLESVLPYTTVSGEVITAENYQSFVSDGVIQNSNGIALPENEQTIIYEQDFQTATNEFNRFVDDIAACYRIGGTGDNYENFNASFGTGNSAAGIVYVLTPHTESTLTEAYLTINLATTAGGECTTLPLSILDTLVAITQFQFLDTTSTIINSSQAEQILDTTIFELLPQQSTRQERINNFFTEYSLLKATPPDLTDNDGDGAADINFEDYDNSNDITLNPNDGFIVRLDENANVENKDQTLEWLRQDLNSYFDEQGNNLQEELPTYQDRSSGYLKFREMNQAILIRNSENNSVIKDNETFMSNAQNGFTITMWVKFKDKVTDGTLFNYGNPLRENNPYGFMLETYVLNANENTRNNGADITSIDEEGNIRYSDWGSLATFTGLNYFDNNDEARFLRLVVASDISVDGNETTSEIKLYDSHTAINFFNDKGTISKSGDLQNGETKIAGEDINSPANVRRFISTTNVPIDFNEWYFIVATYNPTNDETYVSEDASNQPLYWDGNLEGNLSTQTYDSGLGNKCKVEIISKTDLLRARGYKT